MMRRIKIMVMIMMTFAVLILTACTGTHETADTGNKVYVYDLSSDMSHVQADEYELKGDDLSENVGKLLQRMIDGPRGGRIRSAIPDEVNKVTYMLGPQTVAVEFGGDLSEVQKIRRILCEAAVVRTLCQLDNVYAVSFSENGVPVCDSNGIPIGLLTPDSFVENDGSMINAYERAQLHLFFASEDGQRLVEKTETVTYNSNISMDRLIVDNIVDGPKSTDAFATVDPATVVNSVTTVDGICYVNLSRDFLNKTTNVSDEVILYSIVDSLTWLVNVNKVQILIDGEMDMKLGEYDLSRMYERNLELIGQ